jgi:hypothetical protein
VSACESAPQAVAADTENYVPQTKIETTTTTETPLDEIEYKTIAPPEDGWTLELLNEVTYINGKDIDFPFTLDELGDGFSIDDDVEYFEEYGMASAVCFKNNVLNSVIVAKATVKEKMTNESPIYSFYWPGYNSKHLEEFPQDKYFCVINGITIGTSGEEVVRLMGDKYKQNENNEYNFDYIYYIGKDGDNLTILMLNNKVFGFYINLAKGELK